MPLFTGDCRVNDPGRTEVLVDVAGSFPSGGLRRSPFPMYGMLSRILLLSFISVSGGKELRLLIMGYTDGEIWEI